MVDNFSDFYSGNMAPPLKMPGGGYSPAPSMQPSMSPEEIYQGIYGEPLQLTSRSVKTVPVTPRAPITADVTAGRVGLGAGGYAGGSATYMPPALPNQPRGSIVTAKDDSRLPSNAFGYGTNGATGVVEPALASIENAAPRMPYGLPTLKGSGATPTGYVASMRMSPGKSDGIIDLTTVNPRNPQAMADSQGAPVRVGQQVYYPGGRAPAGKATGSLSAPDTRGPLSQLLGLKTSGLGGLLGGLFGGGGQQQQGGGLAAMLGGGSSFGSSPSQGLAMTVDPNTSTGSTLESMGFSSGGAVPAATIRNLSERGYI